MARGLEQLIRRDTGPFGFDAARFDHHHIDAKGLQFNPQTIADRLQREFGAVIPCPQRGVDLSAHGGDVDNCARTLIAHMRQGELDQPHRPKHIDLELGAGFLHRHILDRAVGAVARVVDKHVEPVLLGDNGRNTRLHRCIIRHIHRQNTDAAAFQMLHPVDPARGGIDRMALLAQAKRGGLSDAR